MNKVFFSQGKQIEGFYSILCLLRSHNSILILCKRTNPAIFYFSYSVSRNAILIFTMAVQRSREQKTGCPAAEFNLHCTDSNPLVTCYFACSQKEVNCLIFEQDASLLFNNMHSHVLTRVSINSM